MESHIIEKTRIPTVEGIACLETENQWAPSRWASIQDEDVIVWNQFHTGLERHTLQKEWFVTSLKRLYQYNLTKSGLPLKGFIHHISRCGSTLTCRLFDCVTGVAALNEPSLINSVLWTDTQKKKQIELLQLCVPAMIRPGDNRSCGVIKTTSSSILYHDLLYKALPEVPSIFIYRNPLEVLVSLYKARSGPLMMRFKEEGVIGANREIQDEVFVRIACQFVLELLEAGLEAQKNSTVLVEYPDVIPQMLSGEIPRLFGCAPDAESLGRMEEVLGLCSKNPSTQFVPDTGRKLQEAKTIPFLVEEASKHAIPLYEELKSIQYN